MCQELGTAGAAHAAMPHPVVGSAADPIALEPVDDVVVTTLVDNLYDALLTGDDTITRAPFSFGTAQAPQFEPSFSTVGLMASTASPRWSPSGRGRPRLRGGHAPGPAAPWSPEDRGGARSGGRSGGIAAAPERRGPDHSAGGAETAQAMA